MTSTYSPWPVDPSEWTALKESTPTISLPQAPATPSRPTPPVPAPEVAREATPAPADDTTPLFDQLQARWLGSRAHEGADG